MRKGIPHFSMRSKCLSAKVLVPFILTIVLHFSCSAGAATPPAFDLALAEPADLARELDAWTVLDARPKAEWTAAHIPGSISFSWEDYTRTDEKGIPDRILPPAELTSALGKMGIEGEKPAVYYCTAGVRSGYAWMVHELCGLPPAWNYVGGMEDWKRRSAD